MQKLRKSTQNRKFTKLANQKNLDNKLSWECHTRNPSGVGQIKIVCRLNEDQMSKFEILVFKT